MPTISLCMIAKNEERWIASAIQSVQPIVTEVVLVDTGSEDNTVEIARGLGAKIYFQAWDDDFSPPRNLSLQYATGDWILVLDADEVIARQDLDSFKGLTSDPTRCIEFLQRHYTSDHRLSSFTPCSGEFPELEQNHGGYFESNLVRLFPNRQGIHYRGKVHELVEHSIRDIGKHRIERTTVRIHHYGHIGVVKKTKDKSTIYTPLGEAKTKEEPHDWKNFFELGVEHNNNGRLRESVVAFKEAARLNPGYISTWINMGYVQCELGDYQDAVNSQMAAIRLDPRADEAFCNLGVVFLRVKDFSGAEKQFRKAVQLNSNYVNAYCNLGTSLALQGRLSESVATFLRVIELFPNCQKAHAEAGALYLSGGVFDRAEQHLSRAIELAPDDARSQLHAGQLYRRIGRPAEALACFEQFVSLHTAQGGNPPKGELAQLITKVEHECGLLKAIVAATPSVEQRAESVSVVEEPTAVQGAVAEVSKPKARRKKKAAKQTQDSDDTASNKESEAPVAPKARKPRTSKKKDKAETKNEVGSEQTSSEKATKKTKKKESSATKKNARSKKTSDAKPKSGAK